MSTVPPIAIVALSALLPGSHDPAGFWRSVVAGEDLVTEVPQTHWLIDDYYDPDPSAPDKTYCRRGAFLPPVKFDPLAFGIPPKALHATDTSQLLALMVADRLLAAVAPDRLSSVDRERVSVILGTSTLELLSGMAGRIQRPVWLKALRESGMPEPEAQAICDRIADHYVPWQEDTLPGVLSNVIAGRIANKFDLHGSNYTADAACASSLAALSSGINQLALGQADLVITGGVDTLNDPQTFLSFSKTPALSPTEDCRPYSEAADGMVLGEGIVMFALKRLEDAERDGDRVHAVLRGLGFASDGNGTAIYAPAATGQARALRRAYEAAGFGPETVELVEGHGTGTRAGDAAEFAGLTAVFTASGRQDAQWCALGSVKSQIGHTKNAAGAAGLLKAVLALRHKVFPPTLKVDRPNPAFSVGDSPFYLSTEARPWVSGGSHPRRAGVSSFGFGGADFHVAVEEYTGENAPKAFRTAGSELVLVSAPSAAGLVERCRDLRADDRPLAALARDTQRAFDPAAPTRLALVAHTAQDLRDKLASAQARIGAAPTDDFSTPNGTHYGAGPQSPGRIGFLCSGQGSQYPGMGAGLAIAYPDAMAAWDEAARIPLAETPLHRVVFPPPSFTAEEKARRRQLLDRTEWAQPAIAVQALALLRILRTLGLRPDAAAGHSFGELVALHIAGCYDAGTLVRLARRRGELMRDAAPDGAMTALAATIEEATRLVEGSEDLWVANHNAPNQVVVSGTAEAVERFENDLAHDGGTARRLRTSAAFHSPLVASAGDGLRDHLRQVAIEPPTVDVYANATAERYPADAEAVRQGIAEHATRPVRFVELVEAMYADGVRTFVEIGAGSVLTALTREILGDREHLAVTLDRAGRDGTTALHDGLARLAVRGVALDYGGLWLPFASPDEHEVQEKGAMSVELTGANYGRPYPPKGGAAELPPPNPPRTEVLPVAGSQVVAQPAADPVPVPDQVPVAVPAPGTVTPADGDGWLRVLQESQRQVAQLHATYQQVMADSHMAFLRMAEASLVALSPGGSGPLAPPVPLAPPAPLAPPVSLAPSDTWQPQAPGPAVAPVPQAAAVPEPPVTAPVETGGAVPVAVTGVDEAVLLEIVAERTGYPLDVLDAEMELESDLGVDSIKRVEILSAVRRRFPGLPKVDPAVLARTRSVREVARVLSAAAATPQEQEQPQERAQEQERAQAPESPATAAVSADHRPDDLGPTRHAVRAVPAPAKGYALPNLIGRRIAVTDDAAGLAEHLVAALADAGVRAFTADAVPADADGLILLDGLRARSSADVSLRAFRTVREAAAILRDGAGVLVTVQDTGGDFGLSGSAPDRAEFAGLAALARTAGKEWPAVSVKAIDCARGGRTGEEIARVIAQELLTGGSATDVGLAADGTRTELTETHAPLGDPVTSPVGPDSVIVASGGARGVTAEALRALSRSAAPRIALLGRIPLRCEPDRFRGASDEDEVRDAVIAYLREEGDAAPQRIRSETARVLAAREARATISALEDAGSKVRYLQADIRDARQAAEALAAVRQEWGPVTGIVHGAGVLADSRIQDKTDDQFRTVFATKADGLRNLLQAASADPLDLLVVFSSVAARYGNAGQADYAMANEVATHMAYAERASRPHCLIRSVAWGPWDAGMVDDTLAARFGTAGIPLLPALDGARAFVGETHTDTADMQVVIAADTRPLRARHRPPTGELQVSSRSHPYLADHDITGTPVLPVAMALEWFAAAADDRAVTGLDVLRKISFGRFGDGGDLLRLVGPTDEGSIELLMDGDFPHYRAKTGARSPAGTWDPPAGLPPLDSPIYDGDVLFHGPAFQSLRSVEGMSAQGARGTLVGVRALDWPGGPWHTDPAAVDGALQLAVLWARKVLGSPALPMAIRSFQVHRPGPLDGPAVAVLRPHAVVTGSVAECDVSLRTRDGVPVADLERVRLVARPRR